MDHDACSPAAEFRQGVLATLPAMLAATPFAFLIGALAADNGFSVLEAGLMSALIFAGSAQFVALNTWQTPPPWLMLALAVLVVNLRHVFMSASILRHMDAFPRWLRPPAMLFLADEIWAFAEARAVRGRLTPAYYAGLVSFFYLNWVVSSAVGALAGRLIRDPRAYGFDFAFTAIFIGLIMGFRERRGFALVVAAGMGVATIVHRLHPGPLSIVAGALAGVVAAALGGRGEDVRGGHGEPA